MEDIKQEIKRIVFNCISFKGENDRAYERELEEDSVTELLALFTQSVEEIIGQSEDINFENGAMEMELKFERNKLRKEQRARLATLINHR